MTIFFGSFSVMLAVGYPVLQVQYDCLLALPAVTITIALHHIKQRHVLSTGSIRSCTAFTGVRYSNRNMNRNRRDSGTNPSSDPIPLLVTNACMALLMRLCESLWLSPAMARFEASNPKPQSSNDFRAAAVG